MSSHQKYLKIGESVSGPFTQTEIEFKLRCGLISPIAEVSEYAEGPWRALLNQLNPHPTISLTGVGFRMRALAYSIDFVILSILGQVFNYRLLGEVFPKALSTQAFVAFFIGLGLQFGYFVFFQNWMGSTIGKMILGIQVVKLNGRALTLEESFLRYGTLLLGSIPLFAGSVICIFHPKKQAWHDRICQTLVVQTKSLIHSEQNQVHSSESLVSKAS